MNAKIYAIAFAGCQKCVFVYSCNSYVLAGGGGGHCPDSDNGPRDILQEMSRNVVNLV